MKVRFAFLVLPAMVVIGACDDNDTPTSSSDRGGTTGNTTMSFFVSSATSVTGNLGGPRGADAVCQGLANTAGVGNKTWRAYLSVERDPDNGNRSTDARTRIGNGPWVNSAGAVVARNLRELHSRTGNAALFLDERGQRINGQWPDSPRPIEHDILTGSTADGTVLAGFTCNDWTSDSTSHVGQVGHSDGLGPGGDASGSLSSWNSAHANQNCANTAPRGGAGRIYCFATN
jgi:hypothetical protein